MQRIELFEFNDSPWVPRFLRESQTLFLEELHRWIKFPPLWTQKIQQAVVADRSNEILDLCSGSGGPLIPLLKKLEIDNSPFALSISNFLNFKLPVERSTQPQLLQNLLLQP